jgi:hypothetical protein
MWDQSTNKYLLWWNKKCKHEKEQNKAMVYDCNLN